MFVLLSGSSQYNVLRVPACGSRCQNVLFLKAESHSTAWTDHVLLVGPSVHEDGGCLHPSQDS